MKLITIKFNKPGIGNNILYILFCIHFANYHKIDYNIKSPNFHILYDFKNKKGENINYKIKNYKKINYCDRYHLYRLSSNIEDYRNNIKKLQIKKKILKTVQNFYKKKMNDKTISVGIRTWISDTNLKTNKKKAKRRNQHFKLQNYIDIMNKFPNNNFFIAIDNTKYKNDLIKIFGNNVFFYEKNKANNHLVEDFIELLLLSKNSIFINTKLSTFYQIAHLYSDKQKLIFV